MLQLMGLINSPIWVERNENLKSATSIRIESNCCLEECRYALGAGTLQLNEIEMM